MPIMGCKLPNGKSGFKWGEHGKCYPTRAQANEQRKAIEASKDDKNGKKSSKR